MWSLISTDLSSRNRAFLDYQSLSVTRTLNSYATMQFQLDATDPNVAEVSIGERAIKAVRDGVLKFYGPVWEPVSRNSQQVSYTARDPLAYLEWRRVRSQTTYTGQDAGAIAWDRINVQNGYSTTHMRQGTVQTSVNRDRTYDPGKRELEIIQQLAEVQNGFFFYADPVDGVAGTFAELEIRYPNAGTTREECRFEYGENTLDNLEDYEVVDLLPKNRVVAVSADSSGVRLARPIEDTTSITRFSLFEDEKSYSDITDGNVLEQHAQEELRVVPPRTYKLKPNLNSPLLFEDFDIGDFVRIKIDHASFETFTWARVLTATTEVNPDGGESLSDVTVEIVG